MAESDSMGGLDYATFAWDHRISRYMFLCGFVILIYDHALTLGSEVGLIWQRRLRRPSALWFLVVRYIPLACSCVMLVFHFGNLSPERCSRMEHALEGLMFLQEALVDATLGLRVLAMYGFDRRVLVSMLIISAISVALGLWTFIEFGEPGMLMAPALNLTECDTALPRATAPRAHTTRPVSYTNRALRFAGEARSWGVQLLTDTLIFGLTAYRAYADHKIMKLVEGSLIKRMMKDGAMYFGWALKSSPFGERIHTLLRRYSHCRKSGMVDYLLISDSYRTPRAQSPARRRSSTHAHGGPGLHRA
ncbi:hypothetical protein B0H13DRAFT_2122249 [Mycena leptocephala]|nr:hypothetical protein B0H13DRAFT_2122249 [Mycena leptocephala]